MSLLKRLVATVCLACACAFPVMAQESVQEGQGLHSSFYFSLDAEVIGGSYVWTNNLEFPARIAGLSYVLGATNANDFAFTITRRTEVNEYLGWVANTNDWGVIETNYFAVVTNVRATEVAYVMYTNATANITTVSAQEGEDWVRDFYVLPGDFASLTWTTFATNNVTLTGKR